VMLIPEIGLRRIGPGIFARILPRLGARTRRAGE
jgi:hypothetical protein